MPWSASLRELTLARMVSALGAREAKQVQGMKATELVYEQIAWNEVFPNFTCLEKVEHGPVLPKPLAMGKDENKVAAQ